MGLPRLDAFLLLYAACALAPALVPAGRLLASAEGPMEMEVPTEQPPTPGQDEQRCGFLQLPPKILLAPEITDFTKKSGVWQSTSYATFTSWSQYAFAWDDTTSYFYVGAKLLFKSEAHLYPDEESLGMRLPADDKGEFSVMALKDCDGVIMYVLRAHNTIRDLYEIYNRLGQFVASSSRPTNPNDWNESNFPDQMQFHDENNTPIAVAQSPIITLDRLEDHVHIAREPAGTPEPWEIMFVGGEYGSNSSLVLSQNRWVLAAAVQDRAIREASLEAPGYGHVWFVAALAAIFALLAAILITTVTAMYHVVIGPSAKQRLTDAGNPFMEDRTASFDGMVA